MGRTISDVHPVGRCRDGCDDRRLDIRYQSKNVSKTRSIKSQLLNDPECYQLLTEANAEDLVLYNHVLTTIFPRQIHAYGDTLHEDLQRFEAANEPPAESAILVKEAESIAISPLGAGSFM